MTDQYDHWRRSLAGEKNMPGHAGEPWSGFWRMADEDRKRLMPVAIWRDEEGTCFCLVNGRQADAVRVGTWVGEAITKETYDLVFDGGNWPDLDGTVAEQLNPRAVAGGNSPPTDPAEILREQIDAARQAVSGYAKIADDETLAKAQSLRSRLLELSREADKQREALKRPHFDAAKAVDAKWQPIVKDAKGAADQVKAAMDVWEGEKFRKEQAARADALAAARRAEQEARDRDVTLNAPDTPMPAPVELPPPPAPTQIKGAYGRGASTKVVKVIKEVTDWPALFGCFAEREEVRELLLKLARQAIANGHDVPGVTIEQTRRVA